MRFVFMYTVFFTEKVVCRSSFITTEAWLYSDYL